ncbi:hypothetical protein AB0A73_10135 [Glycomyces sp. NPDC047369]
MYAIEFVAITVFATLCLFLLHLVLFGSLAWVFSGMVSALEERWARLVGERGPLVATRYMFHAYRMRLTRGGRWVKTALAVFDGVFGIPFLLACSFAITGAGVYLVLFVVRAYTDTSPLRGDLGFFTVLACLYLAYLLSPLGFMRPFKWMYSGGKSWYFWGPQLPLPEPHTDPQSRFDASKAVWRLHLFSRIGLLSAALTALLLASGFLLSPRESEQDQRDFLMALLGTAAAAGCLQAFNRLVRSRVRRWHALDLVSVFLAALPDRAAKRPVADASGKRRRALQGVAVAAERQARHLQAGAGPGVEHPTALLLLLSVAHLREHLSGHDSMLAAVPPEVRETLARMAVVLAGTADTAYLTASEQRLHRFRDTAQPDHAPARGPRLSAGIDLTDRATGLFVKVALVVLLLWLLVSQQVAVKDLVQMLP